MTGYYGFLFRGDQATYIGLAKDVLFLGSFSDNIYPVSSLLVATITLTTGLSPENLAAGVASLYFIIFFIGISLLCRFFKRDNRILIISVLMFSTPFIFNWFPLTIYPHMLSTYFMPFIMYFTLIRKNNFIIYLLITNLAFFHPFIIFSYLLFLIFYIFIYKKFHLFYALIYGAVLFVSSMIYNSIIFNSLILYYDSLINRDFTTIDVAFEYASKLGIINSLKTLSILILDDAFMYLSLFIIYIYLNYTKISNVIKNKILNYFYIWIILTSIVILFLFVGIRGHVPDRLLNLNWGLVFAPIVLGCSYLSIKSKIKKIVVVSFLILISVTSIYALYPSPLTTRPNEANLYGEVSGAYWTLTYRMDESKYSYLLTTPLRYCDLIYGTKYYYRSNLHIGYVESGDSYVVPSHFNMSVSDRNFLGARYFILTQYEITAYCHIWNEVDKFNYEDFNKLNNDYSSYMLYNNKIYYLYLIDFYKFNKN
ncbi:MAG: hypothetical protein WHS82_01295 [Candidatus Methanosuratincola sp.]